jgi:tricorn protease-like protein
LICGKTFVSNDDFYLLHLDTAGLLMTMSSEIPEGLTATIYPNPFSEQAIMKIPNNRYLAASIRIFDVLGDQIFPELTPCAEGFIISKDNLKNGIYFYEIRNEKVKIASGKFAVQ